MFGLEILDVALGLVLTYLLMSFILTSAREGIEGILKSRAANLETAIGEILQGDKTLVDKFYDHPLIYALHRGARQANPSPAGWRFWRRPHGNLPSYIPRETFAATLIDLIGSGAVKNSDLMTAIGGLNRISGGRGQLLRSEVEGWYDAAMDRAAGWYKRRTQTILFFLGLALAVALNINSVTIAQHLATDEQSRFYADRLAENVAKNPPQSREERNQFREELDQVQLPIGWSKAARAPLNGFFQPDWSVHWFANLGGALTIAFGYLMTALALMLGAPFWFDVLNRIMVIRSTVKPTQKSPDEPSEEGGHSEPHGAAAALAFGGAGAGPSGLAVPGGGTPALPLEIDDPDSQADGCVDGAKLARDELTDDVDLPAATGGVEGH